MSNAEARSAVFKYELVITDEVIDGNGHVNNVAYVQWMQDAAVAHSRACIGSSTVRSMGSTWVARSHHIEYLSPAFAGDRVEVRTWLAGFRRVRCLRRYEFRRTPEDQLLARGETDWVFVNVESGRPSSIPEEIRSAFLILPDEHRS